MSTSHLYNDFGRVGPGFATGLDLVDDADEEARLKAFEDGYTAGWEDAIRAHEKESERIAAALLQSLQDMSFTHVEAEVKVLEGLAPILTQITNRFLPFLAEQTLGAQLLSEIAEMLKDAGDTAVELTVSPDATAVLRAQVKDAAPLPFALAEDADLSPGQVFLRAGNREREVNFDAALAGVRDAMGAFLDQSLKEIPHG